MTERDSQRPTQVDHFRIERVLCERDDRAVYRAFDNKENRASALKVAEHILSKSSPAFEAWRDGRLDHPSILKFHLLGEAGNKQYIATEFADGGTFDAFLAQVRLSIPPDTKVADRLKGEYITSMIQRLYDLATGLAHLHEKGLWHGNLKPSNIAICTNRNHLKLTDIGTCRRDDSSLSTDIDEIAYRAPELIAQDGREPKWQLADVYALGMILYETLTLAFPFDNSDIQRFVSQALSARPVPAASRNSSLPTNIESVVMKAIAREPSERYKSAAEMAEELQRVLMDQKVEAPEVGPSDRILAGLKRHWRLTLTLLVLAALAGILFFKNYLY